MKNSQENEQERDTTARAGGTAAQDPATGASDYMKVKSLDDALRLLDDAIANGHSDLKELVSEEYQNLKTAITEVVPELGGALGEMGHDAMGRVSEITSEIASKGQEYAKRGIENGRKVAKGIDGKVHENPWLVIGGVAIGAFALGFFLGGREGESSERAPEAETSAARKSRSHSRTKE